MTQKLTLSDDQADLNKSRNLAWEGNNAAFACPVCGHVFIVSGHVHPVRPKKPGVLEGIRHCPNPNCGKSIAYVRGGQAARSRGEEPGEASIEWPVERAE